MRQDLVRNRTEWFDGTSQSCTDERSPAHSLGRERPRDTRHALALYGTNGMAAANVAGRNGLLNRLSSDDFRLLQPNLVPVELPLLESLEERGQLVANVYFIESGFASVVAVGSNGTETEVGLIGPEGMTGATVVLGGERSPNETYIQMAGSAMRIESNALRETLSASRTLETLLLKYQQALLVQTEQTAASNARGRLDERLARWILMATDRCGGSHLDITHRFLSVMLGVRRASVTETTQILEGERMIRATRGKIDILDRELLEQKAGGYYGVPEAEYRRLLG